MLKLISISALILAITSCGVDPFSTHPRTSKKTSTNNRKYIIIADETSTANTFDFAQDSSSTTSANDTIESTTDTAVNTPATCKNWTNNELTPTSCQNCYLGAMLLTGSKTVQYLAPGLCVVICEQGYYSYNNGERICLAEKPTCQEGEVYSEESSSCQYVHQCEFQASSDGAVIDMKHRNTSSYIGDVVGCALSGLPCNTQRVDVSLSANKYTRCNFQVNIPGKNMFSGSGKRSLGIDDFQSCSIGSTCLSEYNVTIKRTSSNSYRFETTNSKGFETFGYETFKTGH